MDSDSVHETLDTTPTDAPERPEKPDYQPNPEVKSSNVAETEATQPAQPEAVKPEITKPKESPQETPAPAHYPNSAGVIVLQWLTYAFWGWLIAGLLWLMAIVLTNAISGESLREMVPYAISASIVVLPLAFLCDLFYRKHEPVQKSGAAMVIMSVHAVLFAALSIAALILSTFTLVNAAIDSDLGETQQITLYTALFAALLYAGAFIRTLNPMKFKKFNLAYSILMLVTTILMLGLAVAGPFMHSIATKGDRVIEQGLPHIQSAIDNYAMDNETLPKTLDDITVTNEDAVEIVKDKKVDYKPESDKTNRYQLCVEYKGAKGSKSERQNSADSSYSSYVNTYSHEAGEVCYKLEASLAEKFDYKLNDL